MFLSGKPGLTSQGSKSVSDSWAAARPGASGTGKQSECMPGVVLLLGSMSEGVGEGGPMPPRQGQNMRRARLPGAGPSHA